MTQNEWNDAIEEAAKACEAWGLEIVKKWDAMADPEMDTYAKARAWDAIQCAAAIRKLKRDCPC